MGTPGPTTPNITIDNPLDESIDRHIEQFMARLTPGAGAGGGGGAGMANGGGGGARRARGGKYEYTKLGDLRLETHRGIEVNIFAVVASFSHFKPTSGSDQMASMLLIDPLISDPSNGIGK